MLEIYKGKYAPIEINNINNEYDSSDEDLITHISKRRRVEKSNEFETFIKGDRAPALSDTLNWWKVKNILNTIICLFIIRILLYFNFINI